MTTPSGILPHLRARLFGERDAVAEQLRELERQGSAMAHLAHVSAFALILLFSAGSLVALGGDALTAILAGWQHGQLDIPAAISVAVSTLLVLCMDVGMVYAASMLRLLATRRADASERRLHQIVLLTVAALEAATYVYMSARYEHPADVFVWALIVARALAAPLLSVYLSLSRTLPITPRDILYRVELAAGQGVIRDVVTVAADAGAPLAKKMALYGAAATMTAPDRTRLDGLLVVVSEHQDARPAIEPAAAPALPPPSRPPTGPGSPVVAGGSNGRAPHGEPSLQLVAPPRQRRTMSAEKRIRRVLAANPTISAKALAKLARVSDSTASKYVRLWRQEHGAAPGVDGDAVAR